MNTIMLKALAEFIYELKYSPDQPRDESGRWGEGGGGAAGGDGGSGESGSGEGSDSIDSQEQVANNTMMALSKKTTMSEIQTRVKGNMDDAYNQGQKYTGKYEGLNQAMRNDHSIADEVGNMSHNEMVAFDAGIRGSGKPEFVVAWRVGSVPENGRSTNFADQTLEPGLSVMATSNGLTTQDEFSKMFIMAKNRPVVYVSGFVHPFKRGSDGEPLLLQPKVLHP